MPPSLRTRILVLAGAVAAGGIALSVWWQRELRESLRAEAVDHGRDIATVLAGEIGILLANASDDLDAAATALDAGAAPGELDRFRRGSQLAAQIIVLDQDRRVVGTVPANPELTGLDWSRQPIAAGRRWSDTFLSPDHGEPGVLASRPWRGGTVAFRLDLAGINRMAQVITPPPGGFVAVVDHQGTVIGHDDGESARRRESLHDLDRLLPDAGDGAVSATVAWHGVDGLACRSRIRGTGWSSIVFQPASHAFATADKAGVIALVLVGSALLAFLGLALVVERALGRALADLIARMRQVADGQAAGISPAHAEFVPVAASFNAMAEAVHRREQEFATLVEALSSVSGDALYDAATASLAGWLGCSRVIVARREGDHLAVLSPRDGDTSDRYRNLRIAGAPGEKILADGWLLIESGLRQAFPDAADVAAFDAEACAGLAIPGTGGTGEARGILACLWREPTRAPERLRAVLELVARRIGVEMERASASAALEEGRRMLHGYLAHLPGPAAITGADGRVLADNGRELQVLGLDRAPRPDQPVAEDAAVPGPDGQPRHFRIIRFPIPGGMTGHLATDETERRSLRERVEHSERLDALGQLAGGIAHDFNNQLAGIMAHAEILRGCPDGERARGHVAGILAAAERSSALTQQLLAFSRKSVVSMGPIDLHQIIAETLLIAERTLDRSIVIERDLTAPVATVVGSAGLLQNAILNLVLNARDAMPEGGRLRIATAAAPATAPGRRMLVLTVADTGHGMDDEVRRRLFEPFFTTKAPGKGNGLGLPAVYGTITAMDGSIAVDSAPGRGTTFTILLPLVEDRPQTTARHASRPKRGSGRILIAEDETALREATSEFLASLGYTVTQAADGQEAIDRVGEAPTGYDLVILDLIMPRLGGRQALARIRELVRDLPVVITSGQGDDSSTADLRAAGLKILSKPCSMARLAQAVQQAMADRQR